MANIPVRHRANVLFSLIGVLLIIGGLGLMLYGIVDIFRVMRGFNPFNGAGPPVRTADGAALTLWGVIVLTIGRYFWRGARKRGLRDRFGRILIIGGYVLLGIALDSGVHSAVGLWRARTEESLQAVGVHTVIAVAIWAIPAAILAAIGFALAKEKALATAEVNADL